MIHNVICLANSYKNHGRCFAGRLVRGNEEIEIGPWVRPVGKREGGELLIPETEYHDGRSPQLLDIVGIPLQRHEPRDHQKEDWSFDSTQKWSRVNQFPRTRKRLALLLSEPEHLWSIRSSSISGIADRVPKAELDNIHDSLRFIRLDVLQLKIAYVDQKWRCRAHFMYLGNEYNLAMTDPNYGKRRLGEETRTLTLKDCYVTVSLAEIWKGFAYKLVAGIVEL